MTDAYVYRIRNWNELFETSRSRELDHCRYVNVPNKQHGMGFTRIMAQIDGANIYGIWHLMVGAASQQKRPRDGWLTDNGLPTGRAWTIDDLAMRWRRTEVEISRALDVLCTVGIGWVETVDAKAAMDAQPPSVENYTDARFANDDDETRVLNQPNKHDYKTLGDNCRPAADRLPKERRGEEGRGGREETALAPAEQVKHDNREAIRSHLCRLRLGYSDRALDEWRGWLEDAGCKTIDEAVECLTWLKRKGREDGRKVDYARLADGYERMWRQKQRMAREQAAAATEAQAS